MAVSVEGIKTQLGESFPSFSWSKRWREGLDSPQTLSSEGSLQWSMPSHLQLLGHTPCSCTATAQPVNGSRGSELLQILLQSPYHHHRVPKHRDTGDLLDTGFFGLDMMSIFLKGRSWLSEVGPLYHGFVYWGISCLLMTLIHRKPRIEKDGSCPRCGHGFVFWSFTTNKFLKVSKDNHLSNFRQFLKCWSGWKQSPVIPEYSLTSGFSTDGTRLFSDRPVSHDIAEANQSC